MESVYVQFWFNGTSNRSAKEEKLDRKMPRHALYVCLHAHYNSIKCRKRRRRRREKEQNTTVSKEDNKQKKKISENSFNDAQNGAKYNQESSARCGISEMADQSAVTMKERGTEQNENSIYILILFFFFAFAQ